MPSVTRQIGLSLGADICWPLAFEQILADSKLELKLGKDVVQCRVFERDKHGRLLAQCSAGGRDLNAGMVASGLAVAYGGYLREQGDAKAKRRGLWGSEFQQPRDC